MNIIKYLFDKKYRVSYTKDIIDSFNYNYDEYERVYKSLAKNNLKDKMKSYY